MLDQELRLEVSIICTCLELQLSTTRNTQQLKWQFTTDDTGEVADVEIKVCFEKNSKKHLASGLGRRWKLIVRTVHLLVLKVDLFSTSTKVSLGQQG